MTHVTRELVVVCVFATVIALAAAEPWAARGVVAAHARSGASAPEIPHASGASSVDAKRPLIDVPTLKILLKQQQVQLIDVREPALYALGHIAGSINVRPGEGGDFIRRRRTTSASAPVFVVYCNCLEERASLGVVKEFTAAGVAGASALKGGVRAWLASGGQLVASRPPGAHR